MKLRTKDKPRKTKKNLLTFFVKAKKFMPFFT
jgi:hypothetical protein